MSPFKVRFKITQLLKIFLFGGMLVFLSLLFILFGFIETGIVIRLVQLVGVLGFLFFAPIIYFLFIGLITRKPAFIISEEGITDKSQLYGSGFIKWDEIENITIGGKHGVDFLSIELYDPDLLMRQTKGLKRLYIFMTASLTAVQSQIDITRLSITEDELVHQFNVYSKGRFNTENIAETNVDEWKI